MVDNKLYFMGGGDFRPNRKFIEDFSDVWMLQLDDVSAGWRRRASLSLGRNHMGAAPYDGKIYAIG